MRPIHHKCLDFCVYAIVVAVSITGCSKMDAPYKDFVKDGVIIYPGIPDSLTVYSGNKRIGLSWVLTDPKVSECIVYWNQRQDSIRLPINANGLDTVRVMIPNLEERTYDFTVYSFDKEGNISVGSEAVGKAYGDKYNNSLVNRFVKSTELVDSQLVIKWSTPDDGTIGEEVTYEDGGGLSHQIYVPVADSAVIEDLNPDGPFRYRTLFLPDSSAIDTFYTAYKDITLDPRLFEAELDKSQFSLYPLPGDYSEPFKSTGTVDKIWTNGDGISEGGTYISVVDGHPLPQWFTIDMGKEYRLSRMKLYQRGDDGKNAIRLYAGGNVKEFEVWGSIDPDPNYNPDDHGGEFGNSWVLLQSCTVNRPSGNKIASAATRKDNTEEDIAAAQAGHDFSFKEVGKVRYIRIKVTENWDSGSRGFINIAAIALWGQ